MTYVHFEGRDYHFERLGPDRAKQVTKAVVFGQHTYALGAKGVIYSTAIAGRHAYSAKAGGRGLTLLQGAARLGVLDKEALDKVAALIKTQNEQRNAAWRARNLLDAASDVGLKLTLAQKKLLRQVIKRAPRN